MDEYVLSPGRYYIGCPNTLLGYNFGAHFHEQEGMFVFQRRNKEVSRVIVYRSDTSELVAMASEAVVVNKVGAVMVELSETTKITRGHLLGALRSPITPRLNLDDL